MQIENLLFILLIAMAVLFRLLASKVGEAKKRQQDPDRSSTTSPSPVEPIEHARVESDEERIRRFLEALGQPTGSRPPPPVVARTDIPPRPLAPVQPPPGPFPMPRGRLTSKERRKRHVILHETPVVTPPVIEVQEQQVQVEPRSDTKLPEGADATPADSKIKTAYHATDIAGFLRSSTGQRNAIILREIFGPPRSLQPLDLVRSA
jgi:nucleoid-associated protein YgaU